MEPPISFSADEVRNKKVDVLHAIRPISPEQVHNYAVRGQYGAGWIDGKHVDAYRSETNVAPDSATETFAAVKLHVDNWRWQGVPFYLRTGKRLPAKISEVSIQFRPVPHQPFPAAAVMDWRPNRLLIAIQPEEGILLRFEAKYPGPTMRLSPVIMQFYYREAFKIAPPEAYETLLLDVMLGDATLFMRADQTEAAWDILSPILEVWDDHPAHRLSQLPGRHLGSGGRRNPPGPGRPQLGDAHLSAVPGRHGRLPGDHGAAVIQVFADPEALSRGAADLLVARRTAVAARGRFSVALSGGGTPRRTYELLAAPPLRDQVPWDRVHVFWGDERCVPRTDPRSNARLAREAWLDHVPIPAGQIHPMDCAGDPAAAARQYEALLREFFAGQPPRLDLILLGLGGDGHTASLFPGTPVLEEQKRWVAAVYVAEQDLHRLTLTAPFINQAALVVFLVAGGAKAGVLREVLHGPQDPGRLPAQLIRPQHGELLWLIDLEAAPGATLWPGTSPQSAPETPGRRFSKKNPWRRHSSLDFFPIPGES